MGIIRDLAERSRRRREQQIIDRLAPPPSPSDREVELWIDLSAAEGLIQGVLRQRTELRATTRPLPPPDRRLEAERRVQDFLAREERRARGG
jgi:hypothetical protein